MTVCMHVYGSFYSGKMFLLQPLDFNAHFFGSVRVVKFHSLPLVALKRLDLLFLGLDQLFLEVPPLIKAEVSGETLGLLLQGRAGHAILTRRCPDASNPVSPKIRIATLPRLPVTDGACCIPTPQLDAEKEADDQAEEQAEEAKDTAPEWCRRSLAKDGEKKTAEEDDGQHSENKEEKAE